MSEADEITSTLSRHTAAMASAAMGVAQLAQQRRARRAQQARQDSEARQHATASQLRGERELAATQWKRYDRSDWREIAEADPGQAIQDWASAVAWEPHDNRAASAQERLAPLLQEWGADVDNARAQVQQGDQTALSMMLAAMARDNAPSHGAGSEAAHHQDRPPRDVTVDGETAHPGHEARNEGPGNVYRDGAEPAQLAGQAYPNTVGQALTKASQTGRTPAAQTRARPAPRTQRDPGEGRERD